MPMLHAQTQQEAIAVRVIQGTVEMDSLAQVAVSTFDIKNIQLFQKEP